MTPCPVMHLTDVSDAHSVPSQPVSPDRIKLEYATSPSPDPCTVTDADPVPARFPPPATLTQPESADHAWLRLPDLSPTVTTPRRVPRAPCPPMHLTDVSDSHSVPSHPVCPARPIAVKTITPIPDPCTVTDADPVPPLLYPRVKLSLPPSIEYAAVPVPVNPPVVSITRRVLEPPRPAMHLTDVSDSHSVPSQPVCPSRPIAETTISPMPAPSIVTDVDPVPPLLDRDSTLTLASSTEIPMLPVPARSPTVIVTRRVPAPPRPTMHLTDVSDAHSVPSQPVSPDIPLAVSATRPRLDPCTVTDADPVPAMFPRCIMLIVPTSTEYPSDMLPDLPPPVITTRRVPLTPSP